MERSAATTRAPGEEPRHLDAVAEPDDRRVMQQCNHFSIREHVALLQKKDPNFQSLCQIFCKHQHQDELCLISVTKFRRWNCSGCLHKMRIGERATAITVSPKQNDSNSGCSISFVRSVMPTSVHHTRQLPCAQRSSQGNEGGGSAFPKSTQECNSNRNPPSRSKNVLTDMNVDLATRVSQESPNNLDEIENISNGLSVDVSVLPQIILSTAGNGSKESQELSNNFEVMENVLNGASLDTSILPDDTSISSAAGNGTRVLQRSPVNLDVTADVSNDVPMDDSHEAFQMISNREETDTQNLCGPKFCDVLIEEENGRINDVLNGDCSEPNVGIPTEDKGPKQLSGHKRNQVNRGPRQAASKRNAGSSSKKKQNKSTYRSDTSDVKFCPRKRKRMRRLSELIEIDQSRGPTNSIDVDHARTNDHCESDKGKKSLEVEKDTGTTVSTQRAEEIIQTRTDQGKTKLRVDDVDDRSSLMNWLKRTHKKVRTEKKDPGHRNVDSSAVSISTLSVPASEKLHHDFVLSFGDQRQEEDSATTNPKHWNKNIQNSCQGRNVLQTHNLCQNEPNKSKQMSFSKGNSTILLRRKVPPADNAKHDEIKSVNRIVKKTRLKEDDKCQMASENSQKRQTKVPLGNHNTHNASGTHDQKIATNKKEKLQMLDEQTNEIDGIPMDVVELLARHQHERQLMTNADSLENSHSRPKITQEDCGQIAAKDGSIDKSTVLDANFQETLTSRRKQKILSHASSRTESPNVHLLEELHRQMSVQGHAVSVTEAQEQAQNSLPVHATSDTQVFHVYPPKLHIPDTLMWTKEQQAHSHMDKEVTIACVSPTFSRHQDISEVSTRSLGTNRTNKLMWDSFKTASRNPSTQSYGAQFGYGFREGGSASTHVFGASSDFPIYPPAVEHYTRKAVNQIPLRNQAMEVGLYDQRIAGQSGLYPRETMPATHLLRLMDSSTVSGFTSRNQLEFEASGSSLSASYGSHQFEKFPLTPEDFSRHQVQRNIHRPLRPLPRVGALGSLLQQDIAKWSEHCRAHSGYRLGVSNSKGIAPFDPNRKENCEAFNSGMFSTRWNAVPLGYASSAASPEFSSPRYCEAPSWTRGRGKVVHPLDKLVRKDICQTNRNPAEFTIISDKNEYMINL